MPVPIREHPHPAPFEVLIDVPQEPEHHVGLHARKGRVLDDALLPPVFEVADRYLRRREAAHFASRWESARESST
jgi:hypothetical protein